MNNHRFWGGFGFFFGGGGVLRTQWDHFISWGVTCCPSQRTDVKLNDVEVEG